MISSILVWNHTNIFQAIFFFCFWFSNVKVMTGRVFGFHSKLRIFLNNWLFLPFDLRPYYLHRVWWHLKWHWDNLKQILSDNLLHLVTNNWPCAGDCGWNPRGRGGHNVFKHSAAIMTCYYQGGAMVMKFPFNTNQYYTGINKWTTKLSMLNGLN